MKILLVCILLAFAVNSASADCKSTPATTVNYTWSESKMHYCEYKGIKFGKESMFVDTDACMACTCSVTELHCCPMGIDIHQAEIPGCVVVADHCGVAILNLKKDAWCALP